MRKVAAKELISSDQTLRVEGLLGDGFHDGFSRGRPSWGVQFGCGGPSCTCCCHIVGWPRYRGGVVLGGAGGRLGRWHLVLAIWNPQGNVGHGWCLPRAGHI